MKLREYLDHVKMTACQFAAKLGITPAALYNYIRGTIPSLRIAHLISKASDYHVTMESLGWEIVYRYKK